MDDKKLAELVRQVVERELGHPGDPTARPADARSAKAASSSRRSRAPGPSAGEAEDLALAAKVAAWTGAEFPPPPWFGAWRPAGDRELYLSRTPARLGVGRAGTRYRTETVLSFLADHASARDAVHSDISPEVVSRLGLIPLASAAGSKQEFLARPELGRKLSAESEATVREKGEKAPQVQIVVADGLSATAVNVNLPLLLPALEAELKRGGLTVGTRFAISNGRVACGDGVARIVEAELLCMLVGERPGLKTAESMGAYVTYMKVSRFSEAMRSVVSNIHKGGLVPQGEGARQVAELCIRGLKERRTGVDVKA
jgi:ethanolamine ammonia-lyase small subunit